ncbi:unnamed protein product [Parnassius apollo]|uniref:(apollo) hypothetical protein n=1 Tax=Parnassius apollo TaxID=110799 RepID=A0A8S3XBE6_PARAO|nr:unnamed protein product [Parnassius apollo]
MDESEDNMSAEELKYLDSPTLVKGKPKKRSIVERELETNLTARVTSPITNGESSSTSRYGRSRRLKTDIDSSDSERSVTKMLKSPKFEKSPAKAQSPAYKMHASNSPIRGETPMRTPTVENKLDTQIENIYNENISLSRFSSEEKQDISPVKKFPKVYIRKDLIQTKNKEKEETVVLIKNIFSPVKRTSSDIHIGNILERPSEKYSVGSIKQQNGYLNTSSVVKTLDFDGNKRKKRENKEGKTSLSKSEIFEMEARCEYQVGDLAWARMGTYPFWPCIISRDPISGTFVKKKLFGRIEHDVLHVTFFGDNGRRGWIVDNMLRKFLGQLEFETTREKFTSEVKKRDPRLYAAFFISEKKLPQWTISVEEAEALLREPKRFRIDILHDMLEKSRAFKTTPKIEKSKKVSRTNSDVSLSESLYDTLFSEDDSKNNDTERSKSKTRNKSLDVSEVVTACLDNMAAKTGITKIQRQSHMDRWLQKAKSKTPEKSFFKVQSVQKTDKESKSINVKQRRSTSKDSQLKKSLSLKRSGKESQDEIERKLSHQNEHDYSKQNVQELSESSIVVDEINHVNANDFDQSVNLEQISSGICVVERVESLCSNIGEDEKSNKQNDVSMTVVNEEFVATENIHEDEFIETFSNKTNTTLNDTEPMQIDMYDSNVNESNYLPVESEKPLTINNSDNLSKVVNDIPIDKNNEIVMNNTALPLLETDCTKNIDERSIDIMVVNEEHEKVKDRENIYSLKEISDESKIQNTTAPIIETDRSPEVISESKSKSVEDENDDIQLTEDSEVHNFIKDSLLISESEEEQCADILRESGENCIEKVQVLKSDSKSCNFLDDIVNKIESNQKLENVLLDITKGDIRKSNQIVYNTNELERNIETEDHNLISNKELVKDFNQENENCVLIYSSKETAVVEAPTSTHHENSISFVSNSNYNETSVSNKYIAPVGIVPIKENDPPKNIKEKCIINNIEKSDAVNRDYMHTEYTNKTLNNNYENGFGVDEIKINNNAEKIPQTKCLPDNLGEISQIKNLPNDTAGSEKTTEDRDHKPKEGKELSCMHNAPVDESCSLENNYEEKTLTSKHYHRNSDGEIQSVDSCNTEKLLNSNDPEIEFDSVNDVNTKDNSDQKNIDNCFDSLSINSERNEGKRKLRTKLDRYVDKMSDKSLKRELEDPEFLKYLELRQDALIDENPQLSHEEITNYLYKTWLYEESVKSDRKKTDDIEQATLVKGLNQEPIQPKKLKKKAKVEKELNDSEEFIPKSKPKRKTVKPHYSEEHSDIENELELFEIFENKSNAPLKSNTSCVENESVNTETLDNAEPFNGDEFDQVEEYFQQLTKPKPNLFKGLLREKVCEVCEKVGNLVKCKGCNAMFHIECNKKETEIIIEAQLPTKGRKRKKRNRGRKQKTSEDSNSLDQGSQSDDKSQDLNASEENLNVSMEDIESESHIVVDAENLEAKLCAKMKEMFDTLENQYLVDSSENELDWSDTEVGKCKIIDIDPPLKSRSSDATDNTDFKCNNCQEYSIPVCFVCKSATSPKEGIEYRQRCQVAHCNRYYHLECLDHWPQTQFHSGESSSNSKKIKGYFEPMSCPRHVCHTCVSDDPRGCKTRFSGDKLARCVRCPATYHSFTKCLPAGTQILTGSHIICPRHYEHNRPGKVPCHVNTGWCFICALGGSLICCEYCPTSFHAECLNIKPPEGGYMCEDCETGRLPLYGEMVWVKLGHYRWWPGIILHPSEIPANILAVKHSPGEFVVRFFGQYDHYWVNRGRVFPFQEGDSGKVSSQKSKIDAAFSMAMEHAQRACEILKNASLNDEESIDIASSLLPPHYVKLKVNKPCGSLCGKRVDIEESSLTQCECNPDEEDPCGLYSQCLNRMLLTECGPSCRAGDRCNNRAFEKRLYPKLVPYRTPHRGWGLKTLEDIKSGQFVIEYVGELIDEEEFKRRMVRKHEIRDENYYFLTLDKERMIDAGPKGNLARFMNHCCEPNCETQKWTVLGDVRVGLFALHDIPANSEVTFNYNLQCAGIEKKRCLCGAKRCSGYIGAKPKQTDPQPKKNRKEVPVKRTYKKRKNIELSPSIKNNPVKSRASRSKPRELTEIEKDLLIIKNATNGISSDSDCSGRLSSIDSSKETRALKRRRVGFSTEDVTLLNGLNSPSTKRFKMDEKIEVGD